MVIDKVSFELLCGVVGALTLLCIAIFIGYMRSRSRCLHLLHKNAHLIAEIDFQRAHISDKEEILYRSQQQFQTLLESMSQKALIANNESFLNLAKSTFTDLHERAKIEMDQKQTNIAMMIEPLQKSLEQVDQKMENLEKERAHAFTDLRRQVIDLIATQKELRLETSNLVKALRSPTGRGQWGEMQLKRVVEMAGMLAHCDFVEQVSLAEGRLRPDLIIRLPGKKTIVVDAKTPLMAYLEAFECSDDQKKAQLLQDHARHVRTHIRTLSQRNYFEQFDQSPEFVVMFIPGESIFGAALEADPSLIEYGVHERVIMATPTTLIALLRAVAYGWQQEAVADNARQIWQLGRDFFKRLSDFSTHLGRVGKHLSQSVGAYNDSIGTFEKRVLVSARKLKDLDPGLESSDIDIMPLDIQTRSLELADNSDLVGIVTQSFKEEENKNVL
ncbi:MAG: DNA recombination protein RmuC [Candidatus Paracaedibacteraceae bacterium]|nr:DNA recombination protein RmuC [Candidatus Paracaedibacteraceae bacterium]